MKRAVLIIRSTINQQNQQIPGYLQDNCCFCRILSQVMFVCAKFISWHCFTSSIITNLHAKCTKLHNCKCCALRASLNLMAPNFELCYLSLLQFYRKSNDTFYCVTQDSSCVFSTSSAHFGMSFAYFWIWIPRTKPNKDSTEALVRMASDRNWRCQRGLRNIYLSTGFLSLFSFWKFQPKLYWIFNCDFWIWPLCTFTDRISKTHEDDIFFVHVVTSRSDCWIDCTLLYTFS